MRAVVVYESIFGNTQTLAEAIADGLSVRFSLVVCEVGSAPTALIGIDLLVVGGPIHAWSLTRELTRKFAREQAAAAAIAPPSRTIGLREYLRGLPTAQRHIAAAAFDTALRTSSWLPIGSAAKPAARRLEARGYRLLVRPEHFYVVAVDGPLEDGERERARTWGVGLADAFVRAS